MMANLGRVNPIMLDQIVRQQEEIERLTSEIRKRPQINESMLKGASDIAVVIVDELRSEIERLHQVCRDAYEVWAGSEGIPEPETAAEAYLYQLLSAMRDEVKKGLR